ncbi:Ser/Thr protein kinase [Acidilobus saccharovorans 345-15]|uniref:Ser/Thr protein kinase n=1 Tax=Acidilobus saccharovorans (strain DSM 16705 / JCM 18335 / VKM B-2471 / 345-15) TaxID=666510 RepID=D9Q2J0_ACIS3|nr:serine/threonine protein kinase [Acidilobus saccharovorans]ADL19528.1 Ser/Thr protein kinase [Acidilobus saccharovorans 345-15]
MNRLISEASSLGVDRICLEGPTRLDFILKGLRVLGKGHAGIVVKVLADGAPRALKIKRTDSKRTSLSDEARKLILSSRYGATPMVYGYTDNMILMDYVGSTTLKQVINLYFAHIYNIDNLAAAVRGALRAARALDLAGLLHAELNRPLSNVMYPDPLNLNNALIVDLESTSHGCGNVNKVASFFLIRFHGSVSKHIRELLRAYEADCSFREYTEVEDFIINSVKNNIKNSKSLQ